MPGADWTRFRVRVMYSHDVYEIACAKLLEATVTSDLNTEDEDNRPEYMKRKNRTAAPRAPTKKRSYTTLASPCIPSLGAIAKEILVQLDSIREQQLLILVQLQKISSSQAVPDVTPDPTHFGLPLSTIEELQHLEETLKNPEEKKNLTVLLGMVGGMTLKDTVGRVLKRAMNTSLARLINWSGANRKPAFKGLILKCVVLDAVRRNALTKDSTEKEIELQVAAASL
ncbi:hypothetical protein G5714_002898 [Onychostoma macrolepis]|uniref:DUF4806 domain-containing protein n=1 Tax=Onychostoma macrolepis TaxID=369639 RepID=A0A7J6D7Y5_9TELE|nr:hypothetical protein G5714_002898 [Onychostoma macrolepis]